jgi:hypothetical protein
MLLLRKLLNKLPVVHDRINAAMASNKSVRSDIFCIDRYSASKDIEFSSLMYLKTHQKIVAATSVDTNSACVELVAIG